ncbi:chemotaxis protein CheW [Horticoccus luteus]|uniref:Chemotaxis protein CheW n=1 Tax=Horticoccus luteus TaxID=2862869 RepID=A0A8F9TYP9_9BACT|nr:chemotaxis protein CheW [Horticoccus luteus]QYM80442.1 chemotaxis protein CheW [Horticoccus luteus]
MSTNESQDCWKRIGIWGDRTCGELKQQIHCRNCPTYAAGAVRLLDVEVSPAYLAEQTRRFAQRKNVAAAGNRSVVIFRLGAEWLALPTTLFSEISPLLPVHSLPHRRDRIVSGVTNVRGELIVCLSLAAALGINSTGTSGSARLAVLNRGGELFAFPADEVAGLLRFDDAELAAVPATLAHAQAAYTRGILTWQQRAVGVLDAELLFYTLNRSLA